MDDRNIDIKYVSPARLKPFPGNPRRNAQAIAPVKNSIERFGFVNPIIARASDNVVIAGNTRLKASKKAGIKKVPVVFIDMTDEEMKLYNVADNRLGEIAEWDEEGLDRIFKDLIADNADLDITGFLEDDVLNLAAAQAVATAEDDSEFILQTKTRQDAPTGMAEILITGNPEAVTEELSAKLKAELYHQGVKVAYRML